MSKNAKLWTAGTLKSRGWTEELIASLLPKPQRLYRNGRRVLSPSRGIDVTSSGQRIFRK